MSYLLGIDEGTTAVKAVLFDERAAPGARGAAAPSGSRTRSRAGSSRTREDILRAVVEAVAEVLARRAAARSSRCGLDHQGESVLAWDGETGAAAVAVIVWQDKRSRACSTAWQATADAITRAQRAADGPVLLAPASSPGCWRTTSAVRQRATRGALRLGTVDAFLCDRLGARLRDRPVDRVAHAAATSLGDDELGRPSCASASACRATCCPRSRDSVGELGELRHERWPVELPLTRASSSTSRPRWPAPGCVEPGRVKATYGTGVFVLAHAGDDVPAAAGGLLPTVAWRDRRRAPSTRSTAACSRPGAMLEWMCARARPRGRPAALGALAREVADSGGARVLPALAGLGAPWWRPDARGGDRGPARRRDARARRARGAGGHRLAGRGHRRGRCATPSASRSCASTAGSPTSR